MTKPVEPFGRLNVQFKLTGNKPRALDSIAPETIIAANNTRVYWSTVFSQFGAARLGTEEAQRQVSEQ